MLAIRGAAPGLLDDPLLLDVSGAPPGAALTWRARIRDDDGFVWRAAAASPEALAWVAAKPSSAGAVAALRSLRPVELDVRVEGADGEGTSRTLTRTLLADGVKARRWKGDVTGSLYLPAEPSGGGVILDARDTPPPPSDASAAREPAPSPADVAPLAAALLASRGVLAFVLTRGDADAVREQLARVPSAPPDVAVLDAVPVPAGVPAQAPADPAVWDGLLERLGARPRRLAR